MASVPRMFGLMVAAAAMLLAPVTSSARRAKLGAITFDLPHNWKVESDQSERLFASGSGSPYTPPVVIMEFCSSSSKLACPTTEAPDAKLEGCTNPQLSEKSWSRGFSEKRWTCSRALTDKGAITAAVSYFETPAWVLRVAYLSGDGDKPPDEFLNDFASSLRQR